MSTKRRAGHPSPNEAPRLPTGLTPALITALATQLAAMLVADLRDHARPRSPEPTATPSRHGDKALTAGPAVEANAES